MVIIEPAVPWKTKMAVRSGILGLGSRLYPGNMQRIFNKHLTRFKQSLSRERQNRASKRKALLAGWNKIWNINKDNNNQIQWRTGFEISIFRVVESILNWSSKVKSAHDGEYFRTISRHLAIVVKRSIVEVCCVGRKQITPSTVHTLSTIFGGILYLST